MRDVFIATVCEAVRSRMQPYGAPLEQGWEIAAFMGLGETWLDAPDNLAEIVTRACPDYEVEADALRQLFHGRYLALEQIGTPQALDHRETLGRSLIGCVASAMCQHRDGDYRSFEVENNGVHWFDPEPRHLEATRSLVGIFEIRPERITGIGDPAANTAPRTHILCQIEEENPDRENLRK